MSSRSLLLTEAVLVLIAVIMARFYASAGSAWFGSAERAINRLARRKDLCVLLIGVAALVVRVALLPLIPVRAPEVHDEFSYLLAADTFSSGRLTNPPHPMWKHFESMHIIQQPTYASMYPPAQGLILALGVVAGGSPWFGVCLSMALACSAICWMLQGWLPPGWALLGASLAFLRLGVFSYWASTYWGGAMAALGGALVLGALPRILRRPKSMDVSMLALGVVVLANSRPYEGLVLCVPVAIALLFGLLQQDRPRAKKLLSRAVLPLGLMLLLAGAAMSYYFWRVTGSPFRMPYEINQATYAMTNPFFWQSLRSVPAYNHPVMKKYYIR